VGGGAGLAPLTADELDETDPLAAFRDRFVFADDTIYADGNSLGRLPHATAERLAERVAEWGARLVTGWHDWIDLPREVGDLIARAALGASPGEVVVSDSTTVNLYKLAAAALDARPGALVTDAGNFPTDRYVLEGLAAAHGRELVLVESDPVAGPVPADLPTEDAALVCLSHVAYRSGALADMAALTDAAHTAGALVLWDLSHSVGAVEIELEAAGADLAVGCTYKYLNAGPGAPAFLYVRSALQEELRSPIWGWFGQRDQFEMGPRYDPEPGIARFLAGTPPILDLTAVQAGAELVEEAGIAAIRAKAVALTDYAVELAEERLLPLGFELGSPREAGRRGAHVALRHPDAWHLCRALIERERVVPDFRGPDSIRFGFPPLYTRFADVREAVVRLERLAASGAYREVDPERRRVT
jgi:kynureninase